MSKFLPDNAISSFDQRVKTKYEHGSKLRPTVTLADNVVGSTHRFNNMGKGMATKRVDTTDVVPMNITHGNTVATLEDWNAPEYTGIFDQQKVNYKEQDRLASIIGNAIGRREDQIIIDALDGASSTLTVGTDIGGTGTGLNTAKCRRIKKLLDDKGVPQVSSERTHLVSADGMEALLGDSDANTFDKNAIKILYDGEVHHWVGMKFIMIETRAEGGLAKSGSVRTSFAYHRDAVGLAVGINMRTEVNYIPQKTSWLANGIFSGGGKHIDTDGIVEIDTTES